METITISRKDTLPVASQKKILELGTEKVKKLLSKNNRLVKVDIVDTWKPNDEYEDVNEAGETILSECSGYGVRVMLHYKSGKQFPKNIPLTIK